MNKPISFVLVITVFTGALLVRFLYGQTDVSATIHPAKGGLIAGNGVKLVIGPDAINETRVISLREANRSVSMERAAVESSLAFGGPVWHFASKETVFLQPAELILRYEERPAENRNVENIVAARWDGRQWIPITDGYIDTTAHQIHVPVSVLSDYAVFFGPNGQTYPLAALLRTGDLSEAVQASLPVHTSGTVEHWMIDLRGKGSISSLLMDRLSFSQGYVLDQEVQTALTLVLSERMINQRTLRDGQALQIQASSLALTTHRVSPGEGDDLPKLATKISAVALQDQISDLNSRLFPALTGVLSQASSRPLRVLVSKIRMASDITSGTVRNGWLFFLPVGQEEEWRLKGNLISSIRIDPANDRQPFIPGTTVALSVSSGLTETVVSETPSLGLQEYDSEVTVVLKPTANPPLDFTPASTLPATAPIGPDRAAESAPTPTRPADVGPKNPAIKNTPTATGKPTGTSVPTTLPTIRATPTSTPKARPANPATPVPKKPTDTPEPTDTPKKPTNTPKPTETPEPPKRPPPTLANTSTSTRQVGPTSTPRFDPTSTPTRKKKGD